MWVMPWHRRRAAPSGKMRVRAASSKCAAVAAACRRAQDRVRVRPSNRWPSRREIASPLRRGPVNAVRASSRFPPPSQGLDPPKTASTEIEANRLIRRSAPSLRPLSPSRFSPSPVRRNLLSTSGLRACLSESLSLRDIFVSHPIGVRAPDLVRGVSPAHLAHLDRHAVVIMGFHCG